jgi:flagellar protein FliL
MSSAPASDAPKKGNKKLIIIIAAVLLLVLGGGGAFAYIQKQKAAAAAAAGDEEEEEGDAPAPHAEAKKHDSKHPPTFVPLEPFVVNLADKESDRFAQVGVTLEVEDAKFAEELKAYMPAIRNGILMVLAHKTSAELLSQDGKIALQKEILRESVLPLGIEVEDEDDAPAKGRKKKRRAVYNPVKNVHFSNFIVQ